MLIEIAPIGTQALVNAPKRFFGALQIAKLLSTKRLKHARTH